MLAAITYQLRDALKARGVPYPVSYGPERVGQTVLADSHIVVERDRDRGDDVSPPPTSRYNPHLDHVRDIGAICRIYARSTLAGAGPEDHERVADTVADQVLIVLRSIVSARRTAWAVRSAKLLSTAEAEYNGINWPGCVYELRFAISRGVTVATFVGEIAGETKFGGAHGTTVATSLDTTGGPGPSTDLPSAETRI